MRTAIPIEERFWRFVPERPKGRCWPWRGATDGRGYGVLAGGKRGSKKVRAHRVSYEIHHGPVPEGHVVSQRCGNHWCTNPECLVAQTRSEATRMAIARDGIWHRRGEENHRAKLTDEQVARLRNLHARGATTRQLREVSGLSHAGITHILSGKRRAA